MANKRISELTTITGANLADADLLVVVDVSDTTMAASGTNKKITMAELAKDSALTDNLIAKTTLTTDGDVLTRAAGAPARITRADLAQDSAFSSRYMAISSGIEFAWANDMRSTRGSVALSELSTTESAYTVMLYDSASSESAVMYCKVPDGATTVAVDIYWTNAGAGSGDVRWSLEQVKGLIDGGTTTSDLASAPRLVTATAPATDTVEVTELANNYTVTTGARLVRLTITRYGGDGADTLGNDAALIAVALRRV